jgi:hypothetical protein
MNPEPEGPINGAWMPTGGFAPDTGITRERFERSITNQLGGGMSRTNPGFVSRTGLNVLDSGSAPSRSTERVVDAIPEERIRLLELDCEGAEFEILSAPKMARTSSRFGGAR